MFKELIGSKICYQRQRLNSIKLHYKRLQIINQPKTFKKPLPKQIIVAKDRMRALTQYQYRQRNDISSPKQENIYKKSNEKLKHYRSTFQRRNFIKKNINPILKGPKIQTKWSMIQQKVRQCIEIGGQNKIVQAQFINGKLAIYIKGFKQEVRQYYISQKKALRLMRQRFDCYLVKLIRNIEQSQGQLIISQNTQKQNK